jgi:MFS family permease
MTITATLTTPISSEFKSLSLLSWLASAYLISCAACQPVAGKLTDIFSRRNGLIFSNLFFGVGCLICGLARNEWVMIFGRVVSGIGGGGLTSISTFATSDLVPLRTRGVWQGYGNVVFGSGMGLGGVIGGLLNDTLGWRWAFLMQVPFTVVSGILVSVLVNIPVKETEQSAWKRVDYRGAGLLTLALVLFLLGLNTGGNQLPWSHPLVLTALSLSLVFLLLFVYVEDKIAPEPIIPVRLLLHRTVWAACFTNLFSTMPIFLLYFYVPFYLQVDGHSATQAGLRLIPQAFAVSLGSIGAGLAMRKTGRYYLINCIAMILFIAGAALVCTLSFSSHAWESYVYLIPGGLGYGGMLTITLVALIAAIDHEHQAVITSASYAFRSTGSTIGITVGSAVFQNWLRRLLIQAFDKLPQKDDLARRIRDDFHEIARLRSPILRQTALDCYMGAFRATFLTALGIAVLAGCTSLFMKEHKLHSNLARK